MPFTIPIHSPPHFRVQTLSVLLLLLWPPSSTSPVPPSSIKMHFTNFGPKSEFPFSSSAFQLAILGFACILALSSVQADSINEPKEAALLVAADEIPMEKRFGAQRFAFAKRRAFAFAKRGFGDDFGGRAFAFAKRAAAEPIIDFDQMAAEKRFAFADSGARRFAFAKRGQWGAGRQFAFAR